MFAGFPRFMGAVALVLIFTATAGWTQAAGGCTATERADPPRIVYECAGGLTIEAEATAVLADQSPDPDGGSTGRDLSNGAVLVSLPPESGPFQIATPRAIASVRGTVFVVDASADQTAVFVVRGVVEVARPDGSDAVELGAGEGVTVTDAAPNVVRVWPDEKVAALMARFGR